MSILKVARMGHPVLRTPARPLDRNEIRTPEVQALIDSMIETMREYNGVGLAAPQVHESVRIFVAELADDEQEPGEGGRDPMVLVNPEIVELDGDVVEDWEGCLSIPDVRGRVPRAARVRIRALDRRGARIDIEARGFSARVLQHEYDHLDGILFLDRMKSFETLAFLEEYSRHWVRESD